MTISSEYLRRHPLWILDGFTKVGIITLLPSPLQRARMCLGRVSPSNGAHNYTVVVPRPRPIPRRCTVDVRKDPPLPKDNLVFRTRYVRTTGTHQSDVSVIKRTGGRCRNPVEVYIRYLFYVTSRRPRSPWFTRHVVIRFLLLPNLNKSKKDSLPIYIFQQLLTTWIPF